MPKRESDSGLASWSLPLLLLSWFLLWRLLQAMSPSKPPSGSAVFDGFKVYGVMFKKGGLKEAFRGGDAFWDHAKPVSTNYILATPQAKPFPADYCK